LPITESLLESNPVQASRGSSAWRRQCVLWFLPVAVTLLFCWVHERWTPEQWRMPVHYDGDSLEVLARIKAAGEGDLAPLRSQSVSRLGAPGAADWNEYPGSDAWANYVLGRVAKITGLGFAANFALWLAHLSAALAFYGWVRLLGHRREWALAGALLFAFSYFSINRGLPHLWLVFTWQVPLILLSAWLVGGGGRVWQRPWVRRLCVGGAIALGASNPYNLFLYLQLMAWALIAAWRRPEHGLNRRVGLLCVGAALGAFALSHLPVWLHAQDEGGQPLLTRNYAGTEIYGLKPIELVLPPGDHRAGALASFGSRYLRWSDWRGETFSPYLGLVGVVGLCWLLAEMALRLAQRRGPRPGAPGLQALWVLLFSSIGGLNSILAFYFGLQVFRATNRYSIFLLALALYFLVTRLSRLTRQWPGAVRLIAAAAVLAVGLWDQIPVRPPAETQRLWAQDYVADQRLGAVLEEQLGAGAMIFQLPVVDFPEGNPRHRLKAYDHFRPYLGSENVRFSFGVRKGRASGRWQKEYERMQPADFLTALEANGFDGLLIEQAGYASPGEWAKMIAVLTDRAAEVAMGGEDTRRLFRLQPAVVPRLPLARDPTYGQGWHPRMTPREGGGQPRFWRSPARSPMWEGGDRLARTRWAHGDAVLMYHNPLDRPLPVRVELWLSAPDQRALQLRHNGAAVANVELDEDPVLLEAELLLRPGHNRLDFVTDRPAKRVSEQRWSLRAFALHELVWVIGELESVELADEED
jgi:hypothetical protein